MKKILLICILALAVCVMACDAAPVVSATADRAKVSKAVPISVAPSIVSALNDHLQPVYLAVPGDVSLASTGTKRVTGETVTLPAYNELDSHPPSWRYSPTVLSEHARKQRSTVIVLRC